MTTMIATIADVFLDDEEDEEALDAIGLDVAVPSEDEE